MKTRHTVNILQQYETLQFEGDSLTYLPGRSFTVHIERLKNIECRFFLPHPSWGAYTLHSLSFCLKTPLPW